MARRVITIETSLPIYELKQVFPHERTFAELVSRIQDEIDDTTDEYIEQIQKCIFSAIRACERDTFYFNQSRDYLFHTIPNKARYGEDTLEHIATSVRIGMAYIEHQGTKQKLRQYYPETMESYTVSAERGRPYAYSYYDRTLFLHPVPDQEYLIRLIFTPYRVSEIRDVDDLNVWFTEAFDMIKCRTKHELYRHYLKDPQAAAEAFEDYKEQFRLLKEETSKRANIIKFEPTEF